MNLARGCFAVASLIACLSVGLAFAHGGGAHVKGTVTSITADTITVRTPAGETRSVHFDAGTVFEKSQRKATVKDLKTGDRVVIDVTDAGGSARATLVRFGPQPRATTK
jgi:preprotein translocase subunit YajC